MLTMRPGLILLSAVLSLPAVCAGQAELVSIKNVYFLPMGSGFDQYLANQTTMQGVFQVVTDPAMADAVFTDQIGAKFEEQLAELYPPPEEEEPAEEAEQAEAEEGEEEDPLLRESEIITEPPPPRASFARGKGNLFLVHRESRKVLWSIYQRPKDYSSKEMNKTARQVVETLREFLLGK